MTLLQVPDPSLERHLSPMAARELLVRAKMERRKETLISDCFLEGCSQSEV